MLSLDEVQIRNKKVILRLDLNVPIKDGIITDDTKIKAAIPTIKHLLDNDNHILIMSHLGRVKEENDKLTNTLRPVCNVLSSLLNQDVVFIGETRGPLLEKSFINNIITLMENTRFEDLDGKKESGCDLELSKYWASLGDVLVNDAFGTTHRCHASNYGISKYIPTYYGFLVEKELNDLKPLIEVSKRPFTVLMGGAKVDDKIGLIKSIVKECDYLLVGGGIANTFLKANGVDIDASLYSSDYVEEIKELYIDCKDKIILPIDYVLDDRTITDGDIKGAIMDIGPKTIDKYVEYLNKSKLIFINGTVGLYEKEEFANGTKKIYDSLKENSAIKIAGGGDAVASLNKLGYQNSDIIISTGGGATLEYIADKKIKCFE